VIRRRGNRTIKRSASGRAWGNAVTELEKGAFHHQEQNRGNGVNAYFDDEKSGRRSERDIVSYAELRNEMDDKFLNEIGAISDTGDKSGAGNFYSP
jgi:hypothetical protein